MTRKGQRDKQRFSETLIDTNSSELPSILHWGARLFRLISEPMKFPLLLVTGSLLIGRGTILVAANMRTNIDEMG